MCSENVCVGLSQYHYTEPLPSESASSFCSLIHRVQFLSLKETSCSTVDLSASRLSKAMKSADFILQTSNESPQEIAKSGRPAGQQARSHN